MPLVVKIVNRLSAAHMCVLRIISYANIRAHNNMGQLKITDSSKGALTLKATKTYGEFKYQHSEHQEYQSLFASSYENPNLATDMAYI